MPSRRQVVASLTGLSATALLGACLAVGDSDSSTPSPEEILADYRSTEVAVISDAGSSLASVTAAIADTAEVQQLGLSDTPYLPEDTGMLFVFDAVADRTFHMPDMDFGIDIVFADEKRTITSIHHAPQPDPDEDGTEAHHQYTGHGQYVLEVNYGWTSVHEVSVGDGLQFEL